MHPFLLPASFATGTRSVVSQLNESLSKAEAVRACVCYWTQWPEQLHENFTKLLAKEPSFCCVDVHWPTDHDGLYAFGLHGARQFYVFLKQLVLQGQLQARHHLMHTKMLVLDMPGGQAEIWVGSHNFTDYALGGTNFEASVVTRCGQDADFYQQCCSYLEHIRQQCRLFEPRRLAEYKALQRSMLGGDKKDIYQILPVVGPQVHQLPGKTLLLLGDDAQELRKFAATTPGRQRLLVRAGDLNTQGDYLLEAHVQSSGLIDKLDQQSFGIDFSERPYAIRREYFIPYTAYRDKAFGGEELKEFAYWVNVKLGNVVGMGEELQPVNAPPPAWWAKDAAATEIVRAELRQRKIAVRLPTLTDSLPALEWEARHLERKLREMTRAEPEVRVARFRDQSPEQLPPLRDVDAVFQTPLLASAQSFYDEQFQQVYFEERKALEPDNAQRIARAAPEQLKVLRQKALIQERRWRPGVGS